MNKFDKIFEETMNEMNYEQASDEDYNKIADAANLSPNETKMFISVMKNRFNGTMYSPSYASKWANRIKKQTAWIYGDSSTRKILVKLGYKLGEEEKEIKKSQEEQKKKK